MEDHARTVGDEANEELQGSRFTWTIENFSLLNEKKLYSDVFVVGDHKWRVLIFPKGNDVDYLSAYLDVADSITLPNGWNKYAQCSLAVVNQLCSNRTIKKDTEHQFNAKESDWGFTSFMPLSELYGPDKGYLVDDKCVIEADVYVPKAIDCSTYDSKKETGSVGLTNQGETDHTNSLLQLLHHIPCFGKDKASKTICAEEIRCRKESEEALERARNETEKIQRELDGVMEELRVDREQKLSLECQVADSDKMVEEFKQLLHKYKKERDELQVERNNALRVAGELRERQAEEATSSSISQLFTEFSFWEIEEATSNFSQSMKIGEGGYGSVYRGNLYHTQVAVKKLNPDSMQGTCEFQEVVNILSKLRHPNIVTLVGACPEAWALIYEYLPNGSLEDRLKCKNNSTPLSWKTRTRIAAELCSALAFLHSCRPLGVIHGDLNPANILLDANLVSKLSYFGICRQLHQDVFSENNTTLSCRTDPKETLGYLDPEFFATGELTPKSDVYSFGIILLKLLTGEPTLGIAKKVQCALDNGNLKDLLDPTAGDWPFVQATQLAGLALRCSEMNRRDRPDFASEVLRVLEPMRISCGATSLGFSSEERSNIPAHFVCPIFQEIMQDPVFAADGHTYESEAIKGWLESGHDTSPMTNLKLPHLDLVPNHDVRSAIQEWLQQP